MREDRERLEQRGTALRRKRDRLASLLADGVLEPADYKREREGLDRELAILEDSLNSAVVEHLDVERILAFAEGVLCDASRLWERVSGEQRRRLLRALFPEGLVYEPGAYEPLRAPATCLAFNGSAAPPASAEPLSPMVALRGFEPNSILAWLREMDALRQALAA